ncbi:hypothetical protein [Curtobacterium sp. RRHDQ10]|uniref:hypothetical protein n=1 Tax=Curtobacterium phyllosphaerae TaxID=3413379 RepID=UPI003BF37319
MTEDREGDRARLQAIAYGPGRSPAAAAEAARALAAMDAPAADSPVADAGSPVADAASPVRAPAPDGRPTPPPPRRLRLVMVTAAIAAAAFLLGAGAADLLRAGSEAPADGPTSSAAEASSLTRILPRSQTTADQLPAALQSDLDPRSSRLLFANGADSPSTPWMAWVATRTDGALCFLASPDRHAATSSCIPRSEAFGSSMSLVARSGSDVLTVHVDQGSVQVVLVGRN